eukprot:CAMPEP_0175833648 /NCGR_PEP_ID=MMETSP0107_2-20121207/15621_1 /TAXON_ID=195067 ORGANISM="Goniomonas pacifica, Strain CCMP1869" /NCGR_SAMPLE_ID=MMETSP0107_2 /ASSEMBLY_ACC=CAM_ASM_000203 /LENGTH=71 /DNA_ID=CAMNT_0017146789 /DNA_START=136 /DNA_END=347 /DNA_ORIENTATION=-
MINRLVLVHPAFSRHSSNRVSRKFCTGICLRGTWCFHGLAVTNRYMAPRRPDGSSCSACSESSTRPSAALA